MPIFSITLFMKQPPMHRIVTNAPGMNDPHIMTRCQKCLKLSHQPDYHEIAAATPTLFAPFSSIMARYKRVRSDLIIQAQLPCTKRALFCLKLLKFQIAGRLSRHISPNELLNWKMLQTCTVQDLGFLCVPPEPLLKRGRFTWDTSKEMRVSQISLCVCVQLLNWSRFT